MDLTTRTGRKEQGQRIQRAAEDAGLSLEELAREIGCSRALLYQYVSGGVLAQSNRLQKIAQRTGRSLAFFFEEGPGGGIAAEIETGAGRTPPLDSLAPAAGGLLDREPAELLIPAADQPRVAPETPAVQPVLPPLPVAPPGSEEPQELARLSLRYLEEMADLQESYGDSIGLLATCERIVPYARQLGDRVGEARAWLRIGNARIQRGHQDLAAPSLSVALAMFEEMGNVPLAMSCRQSIGRARLSAGDTEGAMAEFEQVAAGPTWVNRWQGTISIAAVHEHRGEFRAALASCEAAAEIVESDSSALTGDAETARSYIISNQANVYLACGDFGDTIRLSQELLLASERSNQREQFIEGLMNLGICQVYRGEWDRAEENLLRAIDLARFSGDRPRLGFARAWLARLLCSLGDVEGAKEEAKEALHIGLETASRRCEIQAQLSLGEAYLKASAGRESVYHFGQALQAATSSSSIAQRALSLQRRSVAHRALGMSDRARKDIDGAVRDSHLFGIQHVEAMAQEQLAHLLCDAGDLSAALEAAEGARATAVRLSLAEVKWRASALAADLLDRLDRPEEAIARGADAVAVMNGLRIAILDRREEEGLLENPDMQAAYQAQVQRLRRAGRGAEASSLVEAAQWPPLSDWLETQDAGQ